ncbi:MAG TPA: hypothetical protein VLZ29_03460 [Sulfurimonas sp.]|uniref:hypothetical protein n=1 Tax=Sulfurimonas sp. TaxID=2022749 RepID=UPI002BE42460|nr:hypothetical protein [Sulfurimonas sp.]HUH42150.1 hypothetical protein [Sulfurimonas sp.]
MTASKRASLACFVDAILLSKEAFAESTALEIELLEDSKPVEIESFIFDNEEILEGNGVRCLDVGIEKSGDELSPRFR